MAQTLTIESTPHIMLGDKAVVYGTGDANGSATGSINTGLRWIEIVLVSNSEVKNERIVAVKNSNNGTAGSADGHIYFKPATTDNTWYWLVIGLK